MFQKHQKIFLRQRQRTNIKYRIVLKNFKLSKEQIIFWGNLVKNIDNRFAMAPNFNEAPPKKETVFKNVIVAHANLSTMFMIKFISDAEDA